MDSPLLETTTAFADLREGVHNEIRKVIVGYDNVVDLLLVAAIAGGHVLLEGPPGVAKTMLANSMAQVLGISFKRIQFTPDTAPFHLIGTAVTVMGESRFVQGPIFTNVLLADEINRTPPRTQAALLEAMQERHVTYEGKTHWLPTPFMVIATQNPFEHEGIYPLPESQLDRFLFKVVIDYLDADEEVRIVRLPHRGVAPDLVGEIQPLLDIAKLDRAQSEIDATAVSDDVARFVVDIARITREHPSVVLGVGPRGIIHLATAARAAARLDGRQRVERRDVVAMAPHVLAHRIVTSGAVTGSEVVAGAVAALDS
jgi:MoxR-like ATPase